MRGRRFLAVGRGTPGSGRLAIACTENAYAQETALAPATDVEIELGMGLFRLLRRGCSGLFHKFTLALFNKGRKFDCPIIRNFDAWRGTSNPHGCDRGVDFHIAGLRDIAGNKSERSLG